MRGYPLQTEKKTLSWLYVKEKEQKKEERKEDEAEGDEEGEGEGTLRRQRTKYRGGNFNALKWKLKFPNL